MTEGDQFLFAIQSVKVLEVSLFGVVGCDKQLLMANITNRLYCTYSG